MRAGRREAKSRTVRQCAKNSALPLLAALLLLSAAEPAAARYYESVPLVSGALSPAVPAGQDNVPAGSASSPAAKTNKKDGLLGVGISTCKVDTGDIDLGVSPSISNAIISVPSTVQITCTSATIVSVASKFCLMFRPDPAYQPAQLNNIRALYGKADPTTNIVPHVYFQMYIGDQLWGTGALYGDYGDGYSNTTGWYTHTSFPYSITAKLDLSNQTDWDTSPGYYSNHFLIQMNYTTQPFQGPASGLCNPNPSGPAWAAVATNSKSVLVHTSLKPACGLITGGTLDFGKQYQLTNSIEAHSSLTVKCSGGFDYTVAANAGYHSDSRFTNAMKCTTSETCGETTIQYLLYDDAGHVWNSQRADSGGYVQKDHMDSSGSKTYNLTAKTIPLTSSPPPGTYTDTIIFTLTPTANP